MPYDDYNMHLLPFQFVVVRSPLFFGRRSPRCRNVCLKHALELPLQHRSDSPHLAFPVGSLLFVALSPYSKKNINMSAL